MTQFLLFPASLRQDSHQRRLLGHFAPILLRHGTVDILPPSEIDLPLFNQDLEHEPAIRSRLRALHARFRAASALVVATPEYNGHVPAYLKNTLDWVSRLPRLEPVANALQDKPVLLASASTGWSGGLLGLRDARSIFSYLGGLVFARQICVCDAEQWRQGDGFSFAPDFAAFIETTIAEFAALSARVAVPTQA